MYKHSFCAVISIYIIQWRHQIFFLFWGGIVGENASLGKGCKYPTIYQKWQICVLMGRGEGDSLQWLMIMIRMLTACNIFNLLNLTVLFLWLQKRLELTMVMVIRVKRIKTYHVWWILPQQNFTGRDCQNNQTLLNAAQSQVGTEVRISQLLCANFNSFWLPPRGYYTPNLKWTCFVCYLKIINTFVPVTQKWHWNFSRQSCFWVMDHNSQNIVLINNSRTAWST